MGFGAVFIVEAVLASKIDSNKKMLSVLVKPSMIKYAWELHLMIPVLSETSENAIFLLFINLIHMLSYGQIGRFINTGIIPTISWVNNPTIMSHGYYVAPNGVQTAIKVFVQDKWPHVSLGAIPPQEIDFVMDANVSISIGQFVNQDLQSNLTSDYFYSSFASTFYPVYGISETRPPAHLFSGQWYSPGITALDVKSHGSDLLMMHQLYVCTNYNNPSFMSFRSWPDKRRAFIGIDCDLRVYLSKLPHIRQMRTCTEDMQSVIPNEGLISTNKSVSFWRETYEIYKLSDTHDILWNLFSNSRELDYFASLQELLQMDEYYSSILNTSLVIAFPSIEVVTCSWDVEKQDFYGKPEMESFIPTNGSSLIFKRSILPFIKYDETSTVLRYGDLGAIIWLNMRTFQEQIKRFSTLSRRSTSFFQQSGAVRRLSDSYRSSLVFTNLQLIRLFGNVKRSVPAHMPHLINKWVMREIETRLSPYVNSTIRHKFREDSDLQYAFLYFHFLSGLMQQEETHHLDQVWREKLDRDGDGVLNSNEFETLAAIVLGEKADRKEKMELLQCLGIDVDSPQETIYSGNSHGSLYLHKSYISNITLESIQDCEMARAGLNLRFPFHNQIELTSDSDVAFQMIEDDIEDMQKQVRILSFI